MKRNEIVRGSNRFFLEKDELDYLFSITLSFRMSCRVEGWVQKNIHGLYSSNAVYVTDNDALIIATSAIKKISTEEYSDIEYAIEDSYKEINPQPGHIVVNMKCPIVWIKRNGKRIALSDNEKARITDNILIVKFRARLSSMEINGVSTGNRLTKAAQKALYKLKWLNYTDIEYALNDAFDEVENDYFNYKLHKNLEMYDREECFANDRYALSVGIDPDKLFESESEFAII